MESQGGADDAERANVRAAMGVVDKMLGVISTSHSDVEAQINATFDGPRAPLRAHRRTAAAPPVPWPRGHGRRRRRSSHCVVL